jgi:hypothetical protein
MPFQLPPRLPSALASLLAAAGIVLAVASCASHITPLGPGKPRAATAVQRRPAVVGRGVVILHALASPIIVQVMRSQPATAAGKCPAGYVALSTPGYAGTCYRKVGTPVTITSAGLSPVSRQPSARGPAMYGFLVVPNHDAAAVTALIARAYQSRNALGIIVGGKLWEAPQVAAPFPAQQMQIALPSRNQALQLYRMLVPSG